MLDIDKGYTRQFSVNLGLNNPPAMVSHMTLIINQDEARKIKDWYETALLQKFIYENYKVSESYAYHIAVITHSKMNDYELSDLYCDVEVNAVVKSAEELDVVLERR